MKLLGTSILPGPPSQAGAETFSAINPATGEPLEPAFREAGEGDVSRAAQRAAAAFASYRHVGPAAKAAFLRAIADGIVALGDDLIARADAETGLGPARLTGERGRTVGQLKMFADVVEEGSWVEARIDTALPDRQPMPRPDLRRMLVPLGPVGVFGASNFPLAFSVAGGDTASALAAGCPVVVKAHPAHPGTAEMVGQAILEAARATGMPDGVFSLLQGRGTEVGMALVKHPAIEAIGFTGSLRGGRALSDAAAARPRPIPVYAEMGSVNPIFLLAAALTEGVADGLAGSITLGVGQFCTNPGVVVAVRTAGLGPFVARLAEKLRAIAPAPMLYGAICRSYAEGVASRRTNPALELVAEAGGDARESFGRASLFTTSARAFIADPSLHEELFGPSSLLVVAESPEEMLEVARSLQGQLTATIHGAPSDLEGNPELVHLLEERAGRLIFNGFPTGVEVSPAMQHGGPYPATTAPGSTSVGTAAITRFARPVAYQNFPQEALPAELRDGNPRGIWRLVDGKMTQ